MSKLITTLTRLKQALAVGRDRIVDSTSEPRSGSDRVAVNFPLNDGA
ncbi:MAG: hypothetical protein ABR568_22575 [Pyrinomonadaceae bacterium]